MFAHDEEDEEEAEYGEKDLAVAGAHPQVALDVTAEIQHPVRPMSGSGTE
jgi:hypothetical protein